MLGKAKKPFSKAEKNQARSDLTRAANALKVIVKAGEALDLEMALEGHVAELEKIRDSLQAEIPELQVQIEDFKKELKTYPGRKEKARGELNSAYAVKEHELLIVLEGKQKETKESLEALDEELKKATSNHVKAMDEIEEERLLLEQQLVPLRKSLEEFVTKAASIGGATDGSL